MNKSPKPRIIFITGTDTGVGKTLLTALLLSHLRETGCRALAIKPFCTGSRSDAEILYSLQAPDAPQIKNHPAQRGTKIKNPFALDQINPFYFPEPLAPLIAARIHRRRITLSQTVKHVRRIAALLRGSGQSSTVPSRHDFIIPSFQRSNPPPLHRSITPFLLIEGAGGLLTPLGEGFNILDLISVLSGITGRASSIQHPVSSIQTILVAPNRLGTINHTLLTVQALQHARPPHSRNTEHGTRNTRSIMQHTCHQSLRVVLMSTMPPQHSTPDTRHNRTVLSELLAPIPVFEPPFLGPNPMPIRALKKNQKKTKKTLALILDSVKLSSVAPQQPRGKKKKCL